MILINSHPGDENLDLTDFPMEPHGQSPWYLIEIPAYAKASAGYPPVWVSDIRRSIPNCIHPQVKPVVFCEGG